MNRGLLGLVGQGMDGRKKQPDYWSACYPPGTYNFRPPYAGYWLFVLNGPGGPGGITPNGSVSGAYLEKTILLNPSQTVALVVGHSGTDTTAIFPSGAEATAGSGATSIPGIASGGDYMLSGSPGNTAGLGPGGGAAGAFGGNLAGAGAPGTLRFPGGQGGSYVAGGVIAGIGAGGGGEQFAGRAQQGGDGRAFIEFVTFFSKPPSAG